MDWEKIKPVLWGAVGGAIVLAIVGFNWGGWVTNGTAEAMAKESAANAVAERLGAGAVAVVMVQILWERTANNGVKKMLGGIGASVEA